jgi:hypothetical protein
MLALLHAVCFRLDPSWLVMANPYGGQAERVAGTTLRRWIAMSDQQDALSLVESRRHRRNSGSAEPVVVAVLFVSL